jgi:hypothetical protein
MSDNSFSSYIREIDPLLTFTTPQLVMLSHLVVSISWSSHGRIPTLFLHYHKRMQLVEASFSWGNPTCSVQEQRKWNTHLVSRRSPQNAPILCNCSMSEHDDLDLFSLSEPSAAPAALPLVLASFQRLVEVDPRSQSSSDFALYAPRPAPLKAAGSFSAARTVSAAAP